MEGLLREKFKDNPRILRYLDMLKRRGRAMPDSWSESDDVPWLHFHGPPLVSIPFRPDHLNL